MEPFTDMVDLRAFEKRAEGSFSYLWYTMRFTGNMYTEGYRRKFGCSQVLKGDLA